MTSTDLLALIKSLGVHALIAIVLLISVSLSSDVVMPVNNTVTVPVIKATFIDAQAIADEKRAQAQAEAQAKAAQQRKNKEAQEQRRKDAAARKAKEKKAREAAEAKKQLELRKLAEQKARERKEREANEKAQAQRKAKEAKERAEMERIMQEQLAQEQAQLQQQRRMQVLSEVDKYRAMISATIKRYLIEDESFNGKHCNLNIRLATTGLVSKVTILDGEPALCRAARSAVLRPDTLPVPEDMDVYSEIKDINLKVEL